MSTRDRSPNKKGREDVARLLPALMEAGFTGRNELARSIGVSGSTVSAAAALVGIRFDALETATATAVAANRALAKRAGLAEEFAEQASKLLGAIDVADAAAARALMVAAAIGADKALALDAYVRARVAEDAADQVRQDAIREERIRLQAQSSAAALVKATNDELELLRLEAAADGVDLDDLAALTEEFE